MKAKLRKENYIICAHRWQQTIMIANRLSHFLSTYFFTCIIHFTGIHLCNSWNHTNEVVTDLISILYICGNPGSGKWSDLCEITFLKSVSFIVSFFYFWQGEGEQKAHTLQRFIKESLLSSGGWGHIGKVIEECVKKGGGYLKGGFKLLRQRERGHKPFRRRLTMEVWPWWDSSWSLALGTLHQLERLSATTSVSCLPASKIEKKDRWWTGQLYEAWVLIWIVFQ